MKIHEVKGFSDLPLTNIPAGGREFALVQVNGTDVALLLDQLGPGLGSASSWAVRLNDCGHGINRARFWCFCCCHLGAGGGRIVNELARGHGIKTILARTIQEAPEGGVDFIAGLAEVEGYFERLENPHENLRKVSEVLIRQGKG